MRDRLIHHYFDINLDVLWQKVTTDLPQLLAALPGIAPRQHLGGGPAGTEIADANSAHRYSGQGCTSIHESLVALLSGPVWAQFCHASTTKPPAAPIFDQFPGWAAVLGLYDIVALSISIVKTIAVNGSVARRVVVRERWRLDHGRAASRVEHQAQQQPQRTDGGEDPTDQLQVDARHADIDGQRQDESGR